MTQEDRFVKIIGLMESSNNPRAWGDGELACGRFQWHPSAYATWGPKPEDFGGIERSWDWAFEFALRKFHRRAHTAFPDKFEVQIAMAWHLHGSRRWEGFDAAYGNLWLDAAAAVDAEAKGNG